MKYEGHFAFFDEHSKKEIRRTILKAIAIPGYQVAFASRELPIARGWGTGGIQITLSIIEQSDVLKVIDQGNDESVNAVNIKKLVVGTTGVKETIDTNEATVIQSRHRIPEVKLKDKQVMVLQVPIPEPLRMIEPSEEKTKQLHADQAYSGAYIRLFEQIMKYNHITLDADYPVIVNDRYVMAPSPIPRFDNSKLHMSEALILLGAGREKKIYAVPPYTKVESLHFEDYPFEVEDFSDRVCRKSGLTNVYMDELKDEITGETYYLTNDTSYMLQAMNGGGTVE
ncbi:alpha-D-ribose 1-methylphosphonate 5-phosphate C-P-lyase PhnJ [Macrococcoides caseolyticum]|uniref:alpha-D-ribose 1-methylphosphonate 5-phosphate C-P-lyase PhnJ n=1 Tax=Macrococcoides caseolyticum TaxID=69966 RepID=UPI001F44F0F3|nr:alpha-D-ribose 1-methylphosphonate 5-phosphate C-P-lyase PhnJ [Macrococcus caseolyticus]MCE4956014.1 alpha-D-ribose 1-methylphosphonate 5-phosphate C-P-lyase PhnJ [Macrococcus caseolyticus]